MRLLLAVILSSISFAAVAVDPMGTKTSTMMPQSVDRALQTFAQAPRCSRRAEAWDLVEVLPVVLDLDTWLADDTQRPRALASSGLMAAAGVPDKYFEGTVPTDEWLLEDQKGFKTYIGFMYAYYTVYCTPDQDETGERVYLAFVLSQETVLASVMVIDQIE